MGLGKNKASEPTGRRQRLIIYTRFSSEMQRTESCEDQERKIRQGLDRLGVSHSSAEVIRDEGISGEDANRPGFLRIRRWIDSGEPLFLVVNDQGRLSRASNTLGLVKDILYNEGRFVSTTEGIDTERDGWETLVAVMGLHHSTANTERAKQVRQGQEGRILNGNGSAGDFPFGYRTKPVGDNWQQELERGRRPKKDGRLRTRCAASGSLPRGVDGVGGMGSSADRRGAGAGATQRAGLGVRISRWRDRGGAAQAAAGAADEAAAGA